MDNLIKDSKLETGIESTNNLLLKSIEVSNKYYNQIDKKLRSVIELRTNQEATNQNQLDSFKDSTFTSSSNELKELELQFWNDLKEYKEANEPIVIQYILSVYVKLQQLTLLYFNSNKKNDVYFIHGIEIKAKESEFLYNIYIHLGDLSRYQKNNRFAKQFYLKARSLNPNNGQSYNQLALIYSTEPIKSIYYYVRAALSVEPSKIALSNIKFTVKHFLNSNQLIKLLFDNNPQSTTVKPDKIKIDNWLYLIVIAIFSDNVNAITKYMFDDINYWFKFKSITINSSLINEDNKDEFDHKCLFASFDLFIDYCLIYGLNSSTAAADNSPSANSSSTSQSSLFSIKFNLLDYERELKDFKQLISDYSNKVNLNSTDFDLIALRHDFMLNGLGFLQKQHSNLTFTNKDNKYACSLNRLISRINFKLSQLIPLLDKKIKSFKQTQKKMMRNVALQSILNSNNNQNV